MPSTLLKLFVFLFGFTAEYATRCFLHSTRSSDSRQRGDRELLDLFPVLLCILLRFSYGGSLLIGFVTLQCTVVC